MTKKRFVDNGIEDIENQSFTDNLTEKTYWIDNGLDEIVELLNKLYEENEQLKQVAEEFIENKTQHNLWKLRTILKELKGDLE